MNCYMMSTDEHSFKHVEQISFSSHGRGLVLYHQRRTGHETTVHLAELTRAQKTLLAEGRAL